MKMQKVYVGQYFDVRYGAVYADVREAVKELTRPMQPGMVMTMAYLEDSDRYFMGGTIDKGWDPRYNLIFKTSSEAEKHVEGLMKRGWPKSHILVKELKINTKGPDNIDIKTNEHFECEQELAFTKRAMELGLRADNTGKMLPLTISDSGTIIISGDAVILDVTTAQWATPHNIVQAMLGIRTAHKLITEFAQVDPDSQPKKFARLQQEAAQFNSTFDPEAPIE